MTLFLVLYSSALSELVTTACYISNFQTPTIQVIYLLVCLLSVSPHSGAGGELHVVSDSVGLLSLLCPQCLEECLTQSKCSVHIFYEWRIYFLKRKCHFNKVCLRHPLPRHVLICEIGCCRIWNSLHPHGRPWVKGALFPTSWVHTANELKTHKVPHTWVWKSPTGSKFTSNKASSNKEWVVLRETLKWE